MAEAKCNRLYVLQKKVKMVEEVVINVDLKNIKKSWKQLYVISDCKNTDVSVKRARINIKSMVAGPVLVPVPFNIPETAPLLTASSTIFFPVNPSTSVPADHSTHVDPTPVTTTPCNTVAPALLPSTTTVPSNLPTIVAP